MVTLAGKHRELYDALQEKSRLEIQRASGIEVAALPDNERLARDVGSLSLEIVRELLKPLTEQNHVW